MFIDALSNAHFGIFRGFNFRDSTVIREKFMCVCVCVCVYCVYCYLTVFGYVSLVDETILSSFATVSSNAAGNLLVQLGDGNLLVQLGDRNLRELAEHLQSHPYTRDDSTHMNRLLFSPLLVTIPSTQILKHQLNRTNTLMALPI